MGLSSSEDCMTVPQDTFTHYQLVTDRRSDGQIYHTALCIASYADAL